MPLPETSPVPAVPVAPVHVPELGELQRRIDAVEWYHEFDFGGGLRSRSCSRWAELHRRIWAFIEENLAAVDFQDRTVLEIGCWDGYWSFYAERRGARRVLATDDRTQNWAAGEGLLLARELLGSHIEINEELSIYEAASLQQTFDIILCFGVYYHLVDPFHAFAQLRHCCHPGTLVLLEGSAGVDMPPHTMHADLNDPSLGIFLPAAHTLDEMLRANYLQVTGQRWMSPSSARPLRAWRRLRTAWKAAFGRPLKLPYGTRVDRLFTTAVPFRGENPLHFYRPPFGLEAFDDRSGPGGEWAGGRG